jgi:hypothetical protein
MRRRLRQELKVWPGIPERTWPWIPVCDKGMNGLKTDRANAVVRMRTPPPLAVIWIQARIRHWRINWR